MPLLCNDGGGILFVCFMGEKHYLLLICSFSVTSNSQFDTCTLVGRLFGGVKINISLHFELHTIVQVVFRLSK